MTEANYRVPMSSPEISDTDRQAVMDVLQTNTLSMGPKTESFEASIAKFTGAKHAIAVSSGTTGLHLCIRAAYIEMGDMVITTPFSFVSSTNVILFEKAIPVFVDVDPVTGNIDPELVKEAITDLMSGNSRRRKKWLPRKAGDIQGNLKALLPVDVFGQPGDYEQLCAAANEFNLLMIEDSCEALGAAYKGQNAGRLGDFGVFAFYPNKQITTGEGGVVITDSDKYAEIIRSLRNQGRAVGDTWLQHTLLGYNYRLDEMSAALGTSQMARFDQMLASRQRVADMYNNKLSQIKGIEIPKISEDTTRMSWFVYVIRFSDGIDRAEVARKLKKHGIPVRPYFLPIHLQPYMVKKFGYTANDYPITEDLGKRSLALPFSGVMTEEQVNIVCEELANCIV